MDVTIFFRLSAGIIGAPMGFSMADDCLPLIHRPLVLPAGEGTRAVQVVVGQASPSMPNRAHPSQAVVVSLFGTARDCFFIRSVTLLLESWCRKLISIPVHPS